MQKKAILGTEFYANQIQRRPWLEAALLGTGGGFGGYYGSGWISEKMLNAIMAGKSEAERMELLRQLEDDGTLENIRRAGAGLGALAGVGYVGAKQLDFNGTKSDLFGSAASNRHWSNQDVQDRLKTLRNARLHQMKTEYPGYGSRYSSGRTEKTAAIQDALLSSGLSQAPTIPIRQAVDTINYDPFLSLPQKSVASMVFAGTPEGDSGLTSEKSVMQSAMTLGTGAGAGYMLGRTAGAIFSLSPGSIQNMSTSGAVAGALINTGLFSELLK